VTDDEETPDVETPEGSDAETAGPVAEDGPPAEAPEDAPSTPPAEETPEAESSGDSAEAEAETPDEGSDAPAEEAEAAEAPAAAAEPEDDELADLPRKERERILRSREPSEAKPQRSGEERDAERRQRRQAVAAGRRRRRQGDRGEGGSGAGTPPAEREPNAAKVRQGIVVSDKAEKTITVRIDFARRHPTYEKIVRRSRTLAAHDERNEAGEGDVVRIVETRPLSKSKRWRLIEVVEKAR
jgi:small subunit ribosomal protein S17